MAVDPVLIDFDTVDRVVVGGDTHGNVNWVRTLCKHARRNGCKVVFIVGDFGHWPTGRFPFGVDAQAEANDVIVIFLDGNHDWHDDLLARPVDDDGFVTLAPRVRWAPRGLRFSWAGRRIGVLGGAQSTDIDPVAPWPGRTEGVNWWRAEVTTDEDVARLGDDPLDVLLAHEAPTSSPLTGADGAMSLEHQHNAEAIRARIDQAMKTTNPSLLLHGHWHERYTHEATWIDRAATDATGELTWRSCVIEGLGGVKGRTSVPAGHRQHINGTWGVLDLSALTFADGTELQRRRSRAS